MQAKLCRQDRQGSAIRLNIYIIALSELKDGSIW